MVHTSELTGGYKVEPSITMDMFCEMLNSIEPDHIKYDKYDINKWKEFQKTGFETIVDCELILTKLSFTNSFLKIFQTFLDTLKTSGYTVNGTMYDVHDGRYIQTELAIENNVVSYKKRKEMPPVVLLESPYSGNVVKNVEYAVKAMNHSCFVMKEAPIATHLLYTRRESGHVEDVPFEREHGLLCNESIMRFTDKVVVYTDLGISPGMEQAIKLARIYGRNVEYRSIL
jgi:hypothetical protein